MLVESATKQESLCGETTTRFVWLGWVENALLGLNVDFPNETVSLMKEEPFGDTCKEYHEEEDHKEECFGLYTVVQEGMLVIKLMAIICSRVSTSEPLLLPVVHIDLITNIPSWIS